MPALRDRFVLSYERFLGPLLLLSHTHLWTVGGGFQLGFLCGGWYLPGLSPCVLGRKSKTGQAGATKPFDVRIDFD